ncbi:hypothetical protein [Vreelandella subglaciescola]|nr:hypothetical protein [Halomonas subglaciescola]
MASLTIILDPAQLAVDTSLTTYIDEVIPWQSNWTTTLTEGATTSGTKGRRCHSLRLRHTLPKSHRHTDMPYHSTAMLVASDPLYADMQLCMAISRQRNSREEMASVLRDIKLVFMWFFCSAEYFRTALFNTLSETFISGATTGEIAQDDDRRICFGAIGLDCRHLTGSCALPENARGFDLLGAQQMGSSLFDDCRNRERGWVLEIHALLVDEECGRLVGLQALKMVTCVSGVGSPHQNFSTFKGLANQWRHFRVSRIPAFPDGMSIRRKCL